MRRLLFSSVLAGLGLVPTLGMSAEAAKPKDPYGPCFASGACQRTYKVSAKANCRCADGSCREITCDPEVTFSVELTKSRMRATLEAKARSMNGQIVGGIDFSVELNP